MTGRGVAAALAGALAAVATGCGGSGAGVGGAEDAIAAALGDSLDAPAGSVVVTCPDGSSLDEGAALVCDITVDGAAAQSVPLTIGSGGRATLTAAVLPTTAAEAHLAEVLAVPAGADVTCGDAPFVVGEVGESFRCEVAGGDQAERAYDVEITSLDGEVRPRQVPIGVAAG